MAMGRIESEAKRMGSMVEDLLMLARLDEQRPLQLKPVDLQLLAHDAVVDTKASSGDRSITLTGLDGAAPPLPRRSKVTKPNFGRSSGTSWEMRCGTRQREAP